MAKWDQDEEKYSESTKRGFFEKFLNAFGFEAEDNGDEETASVEEPQALRKEQRPRERERDRERGKLVTLNNSNSQNKPVRLLIVEPTSFEEVQALVDHLKSKKAVIINLEETEKGLARRIADFMGGAIYALDGTMQRVSGSIFLFTPQSIEVTVPPKSEWRDKEREKEWSAPGGSPASLFRNERER